MAKVVEQPVPDKVRRQYYDRFRAAVFLRDEEGELEDFQVYEKFTVPKTQNERVYEVRMGLQRLDQIAHHFYGTPFLYWLLALANDIQEPWEPVPIGTLLRIPSVEDLDAVGFFE